MRTRVYVSAPYSAGDVPENVRTAMAAGAVLLELGYSPLVPHLSYWLHAAHPQPYEVWLEADLAWVAVADGVLRLQGVSPGAERETALARSLNIPVFASISALQAGLPPEGKVSMFVDIARAIATKAHAEQAPRAGGEPFITHPEAVAAKVRHLGPEYEAAAWLHDVPEDQPDCVIDWAPFPVAVHEAVILLTHDPQTHSYLQYLRLLSANTIARAVKLADLEHNIETLRAVMTSRGNTKQLNLDRWELARYILEH